MLIQTLFPDVCIHNLSITIACWGALSGYCVLIILISESDISNSLARATQSDDSILDMSDNLKSALCMVSDLPAIKK